MHNLNKDPAIVQQLILHSGQKIYQKKMKIHLETERLILRDLVSTDVDGLFELD